MTIFSWRGMHLKLKQDKHHFKSFTSIKQMQWRVKTLVLWECCQTSWLMREISQGLSGDFYLPSVSFSILCFVLLHNLFSWEWFGVTRFLFDGWAAYPLFLTETENKYLDWTCFILLPLSLYLLMLAHLILPEAEWRSSVATNRSIIWQCERMWTG